MSAAESLRALLNSTPSGHAVVPDDTLLVMLDVIEAAKAVVDYTFANGVHDDHLAGLLTDLMRAGHAFEAL